MKKLECSLIFKFLKWYEARHSQKSLGAKFCTEFPENFDQILKKKITNGNFE